MPGEYDSCGHELYPDLWLEYTATCDGRLTLDLHEDGDWCREVSTRQLSVHTPADCPGRQAPLLCESWSHLSPWEYGDCGGPEGIYTRLTVRRAEALLIRVSGYDSFAAFADLDVRCTPGQVCDANTCASEATCTEIDQRVECECWEGWSGDGVPVARGGSGCTPPDDPSLCEQRGLECHPDASCGIRYESDEDYIQRLRDDPNSDPRRLQYPYCQCNEGWVGSGFECVPRNECAEGIHGCPFHSTCIDETPGFRCECDNGHFRNPYADELECVVVCGDGRIGPGEECDDGNVRSGDGCDGFCAEEPTWRCYQNLGPASYCESTCDDGWIDPDDDLCGQDDNCNCSAPGAPGGSPWAYGGLFAVVFLLQRRR